MKLLVAAEHLGRSGGMERYLDVVLPALAARGATVHVVARTIDAVPAGVTAETVRWADEHDAPDDAARHAVERALSTLLPDAALAVNVMDSGIVGALRAVPRFVYQVHDHRPLCPNGDRVYPRSERNCTAPLGTACVLHALTDGCGYGPRARTLTLIRRRAKLRDHIAAADAVMVASGYVAARARSCGIPRERIVELPPPLPDDAFATVAGSPPPLTVCFAGRVVPQKGLLSLVRALGLIPVERRPLLRALGDGPALAEAVAAAARLGVAIDTPGAVDPAGVRAGIDASALVVLPSLWAEPFGMVGIEAFARQRPVVAYRTGGITAWLDDGVNGVAVAPGDEPALSRSVDALLADDTLRERLGARARADAERYRTGPIVDSLIATLSRRN